MNKEPLAWRMRPRTLDEIVGQEHITSKHSALYKTIQNKHIPHLLVYGPTGTGKTSLVQAIAAVSGKPLIQINATLIGKKELEQAVNQAIKEGDSIIFCDEVHSLTKGNQDFLLSHLEKNSFTFMAATTENPYHSVRGAILSRMSQILQMKELDEQAVKEMLIYALKDEERGLGALKVQINDAQIEQIALTTKDGRTALNLLETIVWASKGEDGEVVVTDEIIKEVLHNRGTPYHDRNGDSKYHLMSAFQKSIRGSNVDAALHFTARLLEAGEFETIIRRAKICAAEDIGISNPNLVHRAFTILDSISPLGATEGRIPLSMVIIELCLSPKSNTAYKAIDAALEDVRNGRFSDIPNHLKDTHYKGAEKLGHVGYLYPHAYEKNWVKQDYLPDKLKGTQYYFPKEAGDEKRYAAIYNRLRHLFENDYEENPVLTPKNSK